jgi:tRNA threonylcarbamoyladenosine dehydratase
VQVDLLEACTRRGIKVLSVGGAGAKVDPTRLRFVDIAEATIDPLIRAVRQRLRAKHQITKGVAVLLSVEKPRCGLVTTQEQDAAPSMLDYQVRRA